VDEVINENFWRRCGSCKKEIKYGAFYQACSVSSCRKLIFCSVTCWDVHVPVMNHKSAYAEERVAPQKQQLLAQSISQGAALTTERAARRILIQTPKVPNEQEANADDILIVASKLKSFVKSKYDMNTSASVFERLSDIVRRTTADACERAGADGRKTVMDRDFE